MTLLTPELLSTQRYTFQQLRNLLGQTGALQPGVFEAGDYAPSPGTNMQLAVAAGAAWIAGSQTTRQGYYHQVNDAGITVGLAAADPTNPRIDNLYLVVNDSTIGGGTGNADSASLVVQAGAPTAGATLANYSGQSTTVPPNAIRLASVLVPAGSTSVVAGNIQDRRPWARGLDTGEIIGVGTAAVAMPAAAWYQIASTLVRCECSGAPLLVDISAGVSSTVAAFQEVGLGVAVDGANPGGYLAYQGYGYAVVGNVNISNSFPTSQSVSYQPSAGSHTFQISLYSLTGNMSYLPEACKFRITQTTVQIATNGSS